MPRANILWGGCLFLFLLPPAAAAPPSGVSLYNRSLEADDRFSYRGRQVTTEWRTGQAVAVIVSHRAPERRRIDILAPDSQRGRCLASDGRQEWEFDPHAGRLIRRRLSPDTDAMEDASARYSLLKTNYALAVLPDARTIADRKAFVLTITRRSGHTLARKLWIDADTGLALRRENYREDGKLAVTVTFSDINFHAPLPLSLFSLARLTRRPGVHLEQAAPSDERSVPMSDIRRQFGRGAVAPSALRGYRLVGAALSGAGPKARLHLRYSDGLNLVSLFEQKRTQTRRATRVAGSARPVPVGRRMGQGARRGTVAVVNWDRNALNLTLMGEMADGTLQDLAQAADEGR